VQKLTHQFVANTTKPGRYFDAGSNLHLLVRSGPVGPNKYWIHRHTHKGRRLDRSLGVFPNVPLSEARKLAIDLRARINNGVHVADAPKNILHINQSFKDYSLEWIEINKGLWSNTKHYRQWISTLESYVYPRIGNKTLSDIGTDDVISVLKPIWSTKTESASRIRERVERILSAAIAKGCREGPNSANWNGYLEFLLPSPSYRPNHEYLSTSGAISFSVSLGASLKSGKRLSESALESLAPAKNAFMLGAVLATVTELTI
jgi:hypothetical protein